MEELKKALGALYEEFGHNEITIRLSEILDGYILEEQRERLEQYERVCS